MSSYKELIEQRKQLDQQISELRKTEFSKAIEEARSLVAEYGLKASDVFSRRASQADGSRVRKPAPVKYRNPATGDAWTGRGKPPAWIKDVPDRDVFAV